MSTQTAGSLPTRRRISTAAAAALVVAGAVAIAAPASAADERTFAIVGNLQDELGCPGDWQPDCTATELTATSTAGVYAADFEVPAGTYEYNVAVNDGWDEPYGLSGGQDNIPLTVPEGGGSYRFTWNQVTHVPSVEKVG